MLACENGHTEVVKLLLARGVITNEKSISGWSALMKACLEGHTEVVKLLLASPEISTNEKSVTKGTTALMQACYKEHTEVVKLLLALRGIIINVKNINGRIAFDIVKRRSDGEAKDDMLLLFQGKCPFSLPKVPFN
jgi:ankyrin repeat protein